MHDIIDEFRRRVSRLRQDAHAILSAHEAAPSRVIIVEDTYERLEKLSIKQDELIRQSLRCVESALYRAAHVMAWAGFMDFLEEKLAADGLLKLRAARPKWRARTVEELREHVPEYQLIEAARDLHLCTKNEAKAFLALLNKRNECAHPSEFYPGLNETLGFVSEIVSRISTLLPRSV
jgi:hypothetical protein